VPWPAGRSCCSYVGGKAQLLPGHDACLPVCIDQRSPKAALAGGEPVAAPAHHHRAGHHVPPRVCRRQRAVRIHHHPHLPQVLVRLLAGRVTTISCHFLLVCSAIGCDTGSLSCGGPCLAAMACALSSRARCWALQRADRLHDLLEEGSRWQRARHTGVTAAAAAARGLPAAQVWNPAAAFSAALP
jgi:hypothetical protein